MGKVDTPAGVGVRPAKRDIVSLALSGPGQTANEEWKPEDAYYRHSPKANSGKPTATCKDCTKRRQKAYAASLSLNERRRRSRADHFKRKYGITLDEYEKRVAGQGGVCAICQTEPLSDFRFERLYVDHNHASGQVRGLLCRTCNLLLGAAQDNPMILEAAIRYLRQW